MPRTKVDETAGRTYDVHAHVMPWDVLQWLADAGLADLSEVREGSVTIAPEVGGVPGAVPLPAEQYDVDRRLAAMDATGIDVAAVGAPPFLFCSQSTDPDLTWEVVQRSNDALTGLTGAGQGRLEALGTVPVGHPDAAREAERCLDELECVGLTLGTYGLGRELDDPVNEDLWAFLADRQVFTLVHPSRTSSPERLAEYYLPQLVGYPAETALAISRMAFGGVLERHDLRLCLAHGGGCLPTLAGRLDLGWSRKQVARTTPTAPSEALRRLYFDTAVFDPATLAALVSWVGADHVLLGTDAPFDLQELEPQELLRAAGLRGADLEAVRWGNARRLTATSRGRVPGPRAVGTRA